MNIKSYSQSALLLVMLLLLPLTACKKTDDHDHSSTDSEKPVLSMTLPSDSMTFNNGDTVKIRGTVTDNSLHELMVSIINNDNDSILYSAAPVVHDLTAYTIAMDWKSQVTTHTNASVIIVAEDHSANVVADTIRIHIMP